MSSSIACGSLSCTRPGREQAHEKLSLVVSCLAFFCGEFACERRSVAGLFTCGLLFTAVVGSARNKTLDQMCSGQKTIYLGIMTDLATT